MPPGNSSIQSNAKKARIEEELTDEQVNSAVRAIILLDSQKKAIKQTEVLHSIRDTVRSKLQNLLWKKVKERLFGIGLKLLHDPTSKTMLLVSAEKDQSFMLAAASEEEKADRTLLILILSYIFMKEETVTEAEVFKLLKRLQIISEQTFIHEYFGDVKKKLQNQFVEEMYLVRTLASETGQHELQWGIRALSELSMEEVLQFVCKVGYDDQHEPHQFVAQFAKAQAQGKSGSDEDQDDSDSE